MPTSQTKSRISPVLTSESRHAHLGSSCTPPALIYHDLRRIADPDPIQMGSVGFWSVGRGTMGYIRRRIVCHEHSRKGQANDSKRVEQSLYPSNAEHPKVLLSKYTRRRGWFTSTTSMTPVSFSKHQVKFVGKAVRTLRRGVHAPGESRLCSSTHSHVFMLLYRPVTD